MKKSHLKKVSIAVGISSLLSFHVFAGNGDTSTTELEKKGTTQESKSSLGTWFTTVFSIDTYTPTIFENVTAVKAFPTDNDVLITWL